MVFPDQAPFYLPVILKAKEARALRKEARKGELEDKSRLRQVAKDAQVRVYLQRARVKELKCWLDNRVHDLIKESWRRDVRPEEDPSVKVHAARLETSKADLDQGWEDIVKASQLKCERDKQQKKRERARARSRQLDRRERRFDQLAESHDGYEPVSTN